MRVLLVEDDHVDASITRQLLKREGSGGIDVDHVDNLQDAVDSIVASKPAAVLLDLGLPDSSNRDTLDRMIEAGGDLPIIVLTGDDHLQAAETAVRAGAQDYLLKGEISGTTLERSIRYAVERHKIHSQLEHMALHDQLTGLANRRTFHDRLEQFAAIAVRAKERFAVQFIDLDGFKGVNDTMGHAAGDEVLIETAERLKRLLRKSDTVARLGGDEFAVLQTNIFDKEHAAILAQKIVDVCRKPVFVEDKPVSIGASVGVSLYGEHGTSSGELLRNADCALYAAKNSGKNGYRVFSEGFEAAPDKAFDIVHRVYQAVALDELHFVYQPILDLDTGDTVAFEALVRWNDPDRGEQAPGSFLPILESEGMLKDLNERCFLSACRNLSLAQSAGLTDARMHINLSPSQIEVGRTVDQVAEALRAANVAPDRLVLELTETNALDQVEGELITAFRELSELGVLLSIDDFGCGYASLRTFQKFPFDIIKVDRSFVSRMPYDVVSRELVRSVIDLGGRLNKSVICEGVEYATQVDQLRGLGARYAQGFYYRKPGPMAAILDTRRS